VLREQSKPLEAIHACERAIVLKPDLAEAYITLGAASLDLQQPEAALTAYGGALVP
jgi:tetratricopeptide (TPR) repeat protein